MSDEENIIREVEEDLRRERYERLWKQYGPFVIGTIVLVLVAMVGWQQWQAWQERQRAREAEAFIAAVELLEDDKTAEAAKAFAELAKKAGSGYATVARLQEAQARLDRGNPDAALAAYDAVAGDGAAAPALRGLAALKGALLLADSASPDDLKKRLTPALRPQSPWRYPAQEVVAYAHYRAGETDKARSAYEVLVNEYGAPTHIRDRARRMLALMDSEAAQRGEERAPAKTPDPGGAAPSGGAGKGASEEPASVTGGGSGDTAAGDAPTAEKDTANGDGPR